MLGKSAQLNWNSEDWGGCAPTKAALNQSAAPNVTTNRFFRILMAAFSIKKNAVS